MLDHPKYLSKETYYLSKETYCRVVRALYPKYLSKETYYLSKETYYLRVAKENTAPLPVCLSPRYTNPSCHEPLLLLSRGRAQRPPHS